MAYVTTLSRIKLLQNSVDKLTNDEVEAINDALCCYGEGMMSTRDRNAMLEHWISVSKRNGQFRDWLASLLESVDGPESSEALYALSAPHIRAPQDDTVSYSSLSNNRQKSLVTPNCIAILLFIAMGITITVVSLIVLHPQGGMTKERLAVVENDTVLIGTYEPTNALLSINEVVLPGDAHHVCSALLLPSSDLKYRHRTTSSGFGESETRSDRVAILNEMYVYLLEGSEVDHSICLGNVSGSPPASLYGFDNENIYKKYMGRDSANAAHSVYRETVPVGGVGEVECTNVTFTIPSSGCYFFVLKVPLADTTVSYRTTYRQKYIDYSDYTSYNSSCPISHLHNCTLSLSLPKGASAGDDKVSVIVYVEPNHAFGSKINHLDVYRSLSPTSIGHQLLLFWCFTCMGVAMLALSFLALVYVLCKSSLASRAHKRKRRCGLYEDIN